MENKIIVKIDVSKINKNKIEDREYTNESNFTVKQKMYSLELIPTKEKVIKETDTYRLVKKYFAVESQSKEERLNKTKTPILGDGLVFENKEKEEEVNMYGGEAEINPDDVPF